ncbi:glycosyltransferase family 2 protein [Aeromonas sp. HZM]|uniref:glycosyltransferase family 2 protein n=1 Tax=Aeromonas sp. HZM TaxID=1454008 RepID=UPI00067D9E8B|nr:glycosyltransferase family 2 protein [Aeromonas sp. HZM]
MLISIITATYNSANEILETYESIKNQTYTNWEWLITDDCSSDNTLNILNDLSVKDTRIKILKNKHNSGAAVARNKSINAAEGEFLAFIDSDDVWNKNKLQYQLDFMLNNNVKFSFTAYELIDVNGLPLNKTVDTHLLKGVSYRDMLMKKATLGCSTVMVKAKAFEDLTMPLLRTGQDYALWLKLLKKDVIAEPISLVLTQYRIRPGSISRNKIKKAKRQWQIYRQIEKVSFGLSLFYFVNYAYRAIFRK